MSDTTLTTDQGTFRVFATTRKSRWVPVWRLGQMPLRAVLSHTAPALYALEYFDDSDTYYHPRRIHVGNVAEYERCSAMYGIGLADRMAHETARPR